MHILNIYDTVYITGEGEGST